MSRFSYPPEALATSTTLDALREVHVYGNAIGTPAAEALRGRFAGTILPL